MNTTKQSPTRTKQRLFLFAALGAFLLGCSGDATEANGNGAVHRYEVRGIVRQLPSPEDPSKALMIHHEAIPDFVNVRGEAVGMASMTMPFFPADAVSLDALTVGDKVAFVLEIDRSATPSAQIVELAALPPETQLDFSRK